MKLPAEAAVPPGVVTEICPLVAAAGTVVEIWDAFRTVNVAEAPLNFRAVAPVKFVPVTVTAVAGAPLVGEKLAMVGAGCIIVKLAADVAVPFGVSTVIFPVVAAAGTAVVICVALFTVMVAAVPLNFTAVAPVKPVPLITTLAPVKPAVGVKLVPVGAAATVKLVALVAWPPGVFTTIGPDPVVALATVTLICTAVFESMLCTAVPLTVTEVAPLRLLPLMVIWVPTGPLAGVKSVMFGVAPFTVKFGVARLIVLAVPPAVMIVIGPVVADAGTVATMELLLQVVGTAVTPLNLTLPPDCVAPKLVPEIVTEVPTVPLVGLNPVMLGAGAENGKVVSI